MSNGLFKWCDSLAALLLLGPLAAWTLSSLQGPLGTPYPSPLTASNPLLGAAAAVAIVLLALGAGLASGRFFGRGRGLVVAGLVLAWPAFVSIGPHQAFTLGEPLLNANRLAGEAVLLLILGLLAAAVIEGLSPVAAEEAGLQGPAIAPPPGIATTLRSLSWGWAVGSLVAAAAAAAFIAWIVAFSDYRGQSLFAALLAGIAAGAASHLASANRLGGQTPRLIHAVVAVLLVGLVGALIARYLHADALPQAAKAVGSSSPIQLVPLARIMPLDWLAGAFLGVPVGNTWAAGMMERSPAHTARNA
jgi:hypothetical protein